MYTQDSYNQDPNAVVKRPGRRVGQSANPYQDQPDAPMGSSSAAVAAQPLGGGAMPNGKPAPYQGAGASPYKTDFAPTDPPLQQPPQPQQQSVSGGYRNQLEGFDYGKLDSDHNSPKYVFARHAQNYNVGDQAQRTALLEALKADPSGYFKNASFTGGKGDILEIGGDLDPRFNGMRKFDVIRAAGEGGKGWQWGAIDDPRLAAAPTAVPSFFSPPRPLPIADRPMTMGGGTPPPPPAQGMGFEELGNNLVRFGDGTVVPKDHPLFAQRSAAAPSPAPGVPDGLPRQPDAPAGSTDALHQALLQKILAAPESLSETAVAQMKEKQKESALSMQQQLEQQLAQNAAARGVAGGGNSEALQRRLMEETNRNILTGNRDIDLYKTAKDREDQLGALGIGEQMLSRQFFGDLQQQELALRKALGEGELGARNRGLDIQRELGLGGLDLDRQRLGEGGRQFDLSHSLAVQQLMQQGRQFDDQLGYNYGVLNYNAQMDPLRLLLGLF